MPVKGRYLSENTYQRFSLAADRTLSQPRKRETPQRRRRGARGVPGKGGKAEVNFKFGAATSEFTPASGWDIESAGGGTAIEVNEAGEQVGEEILVLTRYFNKVPIWAPIWWLEIGGVAFLLPVLTNAGCTPGPPLEVGSS